MKKIQIDDLALETAGVVEIVDNDELDIIVGAMAPGTAYLTSVSGGSPDGRPGKGDDTVRD